MYLLYLEKVTALETSNDYFDQGDIMNFEIEWNYQSTR